MEYKFDVTAVSTTGVSGVIASRSTTIRYAQIKTIKTTKFSPGKTAGLVGGIAGGVVVAYTLVALLFLSAFR